jgi:hypothetical protein
VYDQKNTTQTASVRAIDETGADVSGIAIHPQQVQVTLVPALSPAASTADQEQEQLPLEVEPDESDEPEPVDPSPITGPPAGKQPVPVGPTAVPTLTSAL